MATGSTGYRRMYSTQGEYQLEEHRESDKMNPRAVKDSLLKVLN